MPEANSIHSGRNAKDISGEAFGLWFVIEPAGRPPHVKNTAAYWRCRCKCGNESVVQGATLRNGSSTGCRTCTHRPMSGELNHAFKHGHAWREKRTSEHMIWSGMIARCTNPNTEHFHRYGGRGIRVCSDWMGEGGFARFIEHMGPRPSPKHSIDRYPDNDGNYEPGNCRWATSKQQGENRDNARQLLTFGGRTQGLTEWAREIGIKPVTLAQRINRSGWTVEEALTVKPRPGFTYNGETHSLREWSRKTGISLHTLKDRVVTLKWPIDKALSTPVRVR